MHQNHWVGSKLLGEHTEGETKRDGVERGDGRRKVKKGNGRLKDGALCQHQHSPLHLAHEDTATQSATTLVLYPSSQNGQLQSG